MQNLLLDQASTSRYESSPELCRGTEYAALVAKSVQMTSEPSSKKLRGRFDQVVWFAVSPKYPFQEESV